MAWIIYIIILTLNPILCFLEASVYRGIVVLFVVLLRAEMEFYMHETLSSLTVLLAVQLITISSGDVNLISRLHALVLDISI